MNGRRHRTLTIKKSKEIKKNIQKKIKYDNYNISKGISLKIINVRVEKAKIDIHGNYIFKLDNHSHYEVGVEMDFTGSNEIKTKDEHHSDDGLVFKEQIDSFAQVDQSDPNSFKLAILPQSNIYEELQNTISEDKIDINSGKICEIEYLIGFKINSKIKFEINFPSIEKQRKLIHVEMEFIKNQLELIESNLKYVSYENLSPEDFSTLLSKFKINNFVDWEFSPYLLEEIQISLDEYTENSDSKLINKNDHLDNLDAEKYKTIAVHWRAIDNLIPSGKKELYTLEDVNPLDIIYGIKNNKSVICALTHLAEFPQLINRILPDNSKSGIYKVRLYSKGAWQDFFIDNLIPCFAKLNPIYSFSLNSGWVMIVEKALAKLFKGYDKLNDVPLNNIYKCLTGFPIISIKYNKDIKDKSNNEKELKDFFSKLEDAFLQGHLMTAYSTNASSSSNNDNYFIPNYSYPVIAAVKTGKHKMIILRNIWKEINFAGDFYENSTKLPQNVLEYFETYQEKTVIIMSPREFIKYFDNVSIIHSRNYYELSLRSTFVRCQDSVESDLENILSYDYYEMTVTETTGVTISISLNEGEAFADKYVSTNMDMSIGILSKDAKKDKWVKIFDQDFVYDKQAIAEVNLLPGKYIIIPRTMGYCMRKNKNCYTQYFSPFTADGKNLNMEILSKIFEEIFYLNDKDCSGDLVFKELEYVINRLNGQLDEDEYKHLVKKYCQYSNSITLKGFQHLMKDIFSNKKENQIFEFLKNLGYDKNLYPYLYRFFSVHFYSYKSIQVSPKLNILENYDKVLCNLILEELAVKQKIQTQNSEFNSVSYKSKDGTYYIEGVVNNSKREIREVNFNASGSTNLYCSTYYPHYSKFVNPASVEFFMYLIVDNITDNNANHNSLEDQHSKVIDLKLSKVYKSNGQGQVQIHG